MDVIFNELTRQIMVILNSTQTRYDECNTKHHLYGELLIAMKTFHFLNTQTKFTNDNMEKWLEAFHYLLINDISCLHTSVSKKM